MLRDFTKDSLFTLSDLMKWLEKLLNKAKNPFSVMLVVWKVFSILLEFWWKSDYTSLISQITTMSIQQEENLRKEFEEKLENNANLYSEVLL